LLAREQDPEKAWKVDPNDWQERRHWRAYTRAYESAIRHTASAEAPWYLVPADDKPYRNLCVADAVARALRPYARVWRRTLVERARSR
jgi:polyphosphate kinase 2 (PPK2 family)